MGRQLLVTANIGRKHPFSRLLLGTVSGDSGQLSPLGHSFLQTVLLVDLKQELAGPHPPWYQTIHITYLAHSTKQCLQSDFQPLSLLGVSGKENKRMQQIRSLGLVRQRELQVWLCLCLSVIGWF